MGESHMVGMAEIKVIRSPGDILVALGLGSCIGVCLFDEQAGVAGMAHVVLPDSSGHQSSPAKFADTAFPLLLEEMKKVGARVSMVRAALAGGAQLFAFQGSGPRLDIGPRNASAVQAQCQSYRISVIASDLGGSVGRTVQFSGSGLVRVKTLGKGERELVNLGSGTAGGGIQEPSRQEFAGAERPTTAGTGVLPRVERARGGGLRGA